MESLLEKIKEEATRLAGLMADPQPGIAAWVEAVQNTTYALAETLPRTMVARLKEDKRGSGVTTRAILNTLREHLERSFAEQLVAMSREKVGKHGFTPKQIGDMRAGHSDGLRHMATHLEKMGIFVFIDGEPKADEQAAPEVST